MMPIETFTKADFEQALPTHKETGDPLWIHAGLIAGEHVYHVDVAGTNKRIVVRSSVGRDGVSAGAGKDSIRLSLLYFYRDEWRPLAKLDRWTTRQKGWQGRIHDKLHELYRLALEDSKNHGNGKNVAAKRATPDPKPRPRLDFGAPAAKQQPPQQRRKPNAEQLKAITAPVYGAVRVLAGPGSGKTVTIEERIAHLLDNGVGPDDILCVTFTKTMADEMLRRVLARNPDLTDTAAERQICTIHALCYRLLREEGDTRRVAKEWQVKRAIQEIAEDIWPYAEERPGWKEIYLWVNTAKSAGLLMADDFSFYVDALGSHQGHNLHEARRQFDEKMRRGSLVTFPDMLFDVEQKLGRDKAFREKYQARFKWVLVDEGQDVGGQAMRSLTALARPQDQFYIVGDADQLLFRFAGATPEANLYDGFEARYVDEPESVVEKAKRAALELILKEPKASTVKLTVNYRSTKAIVAACNRLIAHNYADAGGPYDEKYRKKLVARPGAPEGDTVTFEMHDDVEAESQAVVNSVVEALANGRKPGDFFVGARTRAQLGYLEGPLVRAKVPFINVAGGSFWASKHVADVVAYVRLAHDVGDDAAFRRVFNVASNWMDHPWGKQKGEYCHHRYLGKAFMAACKESYSGIWSAVGQRRSFGPGAADLESFMQELQAEMAWCAPDKAVEFVVDNCYRKYLAHEEGLLSGVAGEDGKLEDLRTVQDVASKFGSADAFLAHVAEMVAAAEAAKDKEWDEYLVISTIHRLKGMERPIVYGVGWCEGESSNGQPAGLLPYTFSMVPPPQDGVLPTGGMGRVEDERCCAFVLVSRAESECHLSGCATYRKARMGPSRFIEELGL